MGDYNAHLEEAAYKTLSENFASARFDAPETRNMEYCTDKNFGQMPALSPDGIHGLIDHCFFTKEKIDPLKYETLLEEDTIVYTDHCAQRFTFGVK
jgi:hypothetical protein